MKKISICVAVIMLVTLVFLYFYKSKMAHEYEFKVGIVVPIKHAALDDIVDGFRQTLQAEFDGPIKIEVQNGMGDINLQRSAINKFLNDKVSLLVPVTTGTTQMALSLAPKDMKLLFLAANIPPDSVVAKAHPDLMGVVDEIPISLQFDFMKKALPNLKKFTVIYSATDKIYDEVEALASLTKKAHIGLQKLMVQNLSELYTVSSRVDKDSQAIFILKDNVMASGIEALVQQANLLRIPLITSDEGTNKKGGAFAIGVVEADIGRQGGQMAASFFAGKMPSDHIQYLNKIFVFINSEACQNQDVDILAIKRAAYELNLDLAKE